MSGRSFTQLHTLDGHWPVAAAPTLCSSGYGKGIFKKTLSDIRQLHLSGKEHKIANTPIKTFKGYWKLPIMTVESDPLADQSKPKLSLLLFPGE